MGKYLKLFDLTSEYQAYVNGPNMILPNVSVCKDNDNRVFYNPIVVTPEEPQVDVLQGAKILCKYNVSDSSSPVTLYHQNSSSGSDSGSGSGSGEAMPMFSSMEVDGVEQEMFFNEWTFDTTGEHTVLFTLAEGVTSISDYAFIDCSRLTSVTIGNSVTSIGGWAFSGCSGLTSVTIPDSVTSISDYAFSRCTVLTSVTINSDSIVSDTYQFDSNIKNIFGEQVTEYIIGNGVTSIGHDAFAACTALTSVTIPNSVTSIGGCAFEGCSGLISVTIGNSVTSIGESAFYGCSGLTNITIPNSVTSIEYYAFQGCSGLTSVTINSDSIVSDTYQFDSNIKNIFGEQVTEYIIGNGVTSITDYAFYECSGLTSITIPDSVTSIGDYAFYECYGLTSITIPDSVTSIGDYAFYECSKLTSITIPNLVASIGDWAFSGCYRLTSITIPNSVTSIDGNVFKYCFGLTSISVDANNQTYDSRNNCNAIIETSTNTLIAGCKNTIIPDSVTSIGDYAFYDCTRLTSINIPDSVTSIGDYAFYNCYELTSITCNATTAPTVQSYTFDSIAQNGILTVPAGSTGYDVWIASYLGYYGWTKVEQ